MDATLGQSNSNTTTFSKRYSTDLSKEDSYTINYEMAKQNVFHAIVSFVNEMRNLHIAEERHKPYFFLVTKEENLYQLLLKHLDWGHKPLLEMKEELSIEDPLPEYVKNSIISYHRLTTLKVIYSATINGAGTQYLEFLFKPEYDTIKYQIKRIELDVRGKSCNWNTCISLKKFPNLKELHVIYSNGQNVISLENYLDFGSRTVQFSTDGYN